jgi:Tol biopolymer transport system component
MSPDGSLIVYSSPATGHGDIYRINADGSNRTRLTSDPAYDGSPMFSFDGARICFMREDQGYGHIWIMDSDGKNQKQLTRARESDEDPSFSHDGKRIVFARRRRDPILGTSTSIVNLYVVNTDGSGGERLTNDDTANWEPVFTPDGKGVVFSVWSNEIYLLPLDTKKPVHIVKGATPSMGGSPDKIVLVGGQYGREIDLHDRTRNETKIVYKSESYKESPSLVNHDRQVLFLEKPGGTGTGRICLIDLSNGKKAVIVSVGEER